MDHYKSNSHKSKEAQRDASSGEKKVEKVITGSVKSKKKNEIQKFADVFISEDVKSVKNYILMDVLLPALKKTISEVVTNGIQMILYGEARRDKPNSTAAKVSYRGYYDKPNDHRDFRSDRKSSYIYNDITFDSRGDAEEVLCSMDDLMSMYGMVKVADLYDLVGVTGSHTDNRYGWTDIRSASIIHTREGYMLKLPKALPLN